MLCAPHSVYFGLWAVKHTLFRDMLTDHVPLVQNILRGGSVLLGPGTSGLWRALAHSQNHIPGGGPAGLTELLELYSQNLAQNMKLTYLNPVALVAPNIGGFMVVVLVSRLQYFTSFAPSVDSIQAAVKYPEIDSFV